MGRASLSAHCFRAVEETSAERGSCMRECQERSSQGQISQHRPKVKPTSLTLFRNNRVANLTPEISSMSLNSERDKNGIDEMNSVDNQHKLSFIISRETTIDQKSSFANNAKSKRHAARKLKVKTLACDGSDTVIPTESCQNCTIVL